ncbi:hypothetical protein bAD24_I16650 [Burkholderia sp. AD24]|nr:hypothetical protein bAD24_I16650 [Burkholderia sp. AD24]
MRAQVGWLGRDAEGAERRLILFRLENRDAYDDGGEYEDGSPYRGLFKVTLADDREAFGDFCWQPPWMERSHA